MQSTDFSHICVIGLGYVGLPTATMFASQKLRVTGVDVNARTVDTVNRGAIHFVEPDLDSAVHSAVSQGYLRVTTEPVPADAFLIAVPTPFKGEAREPDLSHVEAAARAIAPVLQKGNLVILESTSPVGTTEKMAEWLSECRSDLSFPQARGEASDICIAHCPESVLPGKVMQELVSNDRVIGGMTRRCAEMAASLYRIFMQGDCVIASGPRVAEMAKLTQNSFRDVNIAVANELSIICDRLGIDVWELIRLANRHPRVKILQPGPGVGGHCVAVDPWFIVSSAPEEARLIRMAREVNNAKPHWVLNKVKAAVGAHLMAHPGKTAGQVTIACYGLSFKADIDDLRESPALEIARALAQNHAGPLLVVEPYVTAPPEALEKARLVDMKGAAAADVHVMLVDHSAFKGTIRPPGEIVDARGIW
jgi:UDP-N-acetyl-D-mannosaminuronic acid dehydrogenase